MDSRAPLCDPAARGGATVSEDYPRIAPTGVDGLVVSFAARLDEPANRAALALRAAVDAARWPEVQETAATLVSTYLRLDPLADPGPVLARLRALVDSRDWRAAALPCGRRLLRIPTCYAPPHAPDLDEAAALAGLSRAQAVEALASAPLRVLTIGFAPGQPYIGELGPEWDIPRLRMLTPRVQPGALTLAIRQLVLFSVPSQTGWRQVGQTAARLFDPGAAQPFLLRAGDAVAFPPVSAERLAELARSQGGGVSVEALP